MIDSLRNSVRALCAVSALFIASHPLGAKTAEVFSSVTVDRASMNPSLNDSVNLSVALRRAGRIDVQVIDRDGFPVRLLARGADVKERRTFAWNGRDENGMVVPDEAYSFRIDWTDGVARESHFAADQPAEMQALHADYYAARTGTLAYTLPAASRVHVQAGTAAKNPKSGEYEGPVLKTIVNREPRAAGRIAEPWNGLDESGAVNVADLPDFVVAVAATPLPAPSIITYGNRERTFAQAATTRKGRSLFTPRPASHAHHAGLSVLDDLSPGMTIQPLNARWSQAERAWIVDGRTLRARISLAGVAAPSFARQPGELYRFIDGRLISIAPRPPRAPAEVEIPLRGQGTQLVALNWRSEYGGVAANALRVRGGRRGR